MRKILVMKIALMTILLVVTACGGIEPETGSQNMDNSSLDPSADQPLESDSQPTPSAEQLTIIIGPQLVDCVGEGPRQCMQVKFDEDDDWQFFYNQIEGFDYQPGYRYTLQVEKFEVQDPPAGGSSLRYVLVEVLDQVEELEVSAENLAGITWVLDSYGSQDQPQSVREDVVISLEYDPEPGRLSGSAGCNRYFGKVEVDSGEMIFSTSQMGMTRMACSQPIMDQETAFMDLLSQVTRFEVRDGKLFLLTDDGRVLSFSPGDAPSGRQ